MPSEYAGRGRVASHIEAYFQREERRSPSVSLLFGYDIRPVTHLNIALLAGGMWAKRASRSRGFTERCTLDGELLDHHDYDRGDGSYDWLAVSFGADAAIAVTKHLAVVPQLRLHSYLFANTRRSCSSGPECRCDGSSDPADRVTEAEIRAGPRACGAAFA